jgi:CYTH domain-containing protein
MEFKINNRKWIIKEVTQDEYYKNYNLANIKD